RIGVGRDNTKFLQRVQRDPQHAVKRLAGLLIVDVYAVKCDVGLVGLTAIDRAVAVIGRAARSVSHTNKGDARLRSQQGHDIAPFEWQLDDLPRSEVVTYGSVGSVDLCLATLDRHRLTHRAYLLEPDVEGYRGSDQNLHVFLHDSGEAVRFGANTVGSR